MLFSYGCLSLRRNRGSSGGVPAQKREPVNSSVAWPPQTVFNAKRPAAARRASCAGLRPGYRFQAGLPRSSCLSLVRAPVAAPAAPPSSAPPTALPPVSAPAPAPTPAPIAPPLIARSCLLVPQAARLNINTELIAASA